MKDDKDKGEGRAAKDSRQDRLKLALRENLRRRKSQARGRGDGAIATAGDVGLCLPRERGTKPDE